MISRARLGRSLGKGAVTLLLGLSALHLMPSGGMHSAQAAAQPPLAGFWFSVPSTAPVKYLHVTVLPVNVGNEPSGRLLYAVDAIGQRGDLGTQTVAVPQAASTPVVVSYRSTECVPSGNVCRPLPIPVTTTLTMVPVGASIHMTVTTRTLSLTRTASEVLIHPFG